MIRSLDKIRLKLHERVEGNFYIVVGKNMKEEIIANTP